MNLVPCLPELPKGNNYRELQTQQVENCSYKMFCESDDSQHLLPSSLADNHLQESIAGERQ